MIIFKDNTFRLDTVNTTYMFCITKFGHLEHVYYGASLDSEDPAWSLAQKRTAIIGNSVDYDKSDNYYNLDNMCLEWSDNGRETTGKAPQSLKCLTDLLSAILSMIHMISLVDQFLWKDCHQHMMGIKHL